MTSVPPRRRILIVDDDPFEREHYARVFGEGTAVARTAGDAGEALALLSEHGFDVMITDVHLSGANGYEGVDLLMEVGSSFPWVLTMAMSSDASIDTVRRARKAGAMQFLLKPIAAADDVLIAVEDALQKRTILKLAKTESEVRVDPFDALRRCPDGVVVSTKHSRQVDMVARHPELACVVYGETGTGKEEIAKLVHRRRCAAQGPVPFVSVNCASLNGEIADSILFGHVKGAFSGADRSTVGLVGEADGGILFLDEVHTLSLKTQYKLLRVMNDGTYSRVGSSIVSRSSFQVIAASTRDLDDLVDEGAFLLDLRARLIGVDVHLPALRERMDDLELFVGLFFAKAGVVVDRGELDLLVERCRRYYWRGNVRQLYKVLQSLVITATCNDTPIRAADLPEFKTMLAPGSAGPALPERAEPAARPAGLELLRRALREDVPLRDVLRAVERELIQAAMERHRRIQDVYRALGIGRNTFDVKRKRLGLARQT